MTADIWHKIENDILDQYLNDESPRPWIIAFSGGKDSTTVLQLVWNSLKKIEPEKRKRPIHIVCNNTLVENPVILSYVKKQLELIKVAVAEQSMPISVEHTIPSMNNTFWVNLIGRGYVAPNTLFRWCTERLKIKPTTKYIKDRISLYGEVIILLGTRKAESNTRSRSIKRYEVKGKMRWSPKFGQDVKSGFCSYNEYGIGGEHETEPKKTHPIIQSQGSPGSTQRRRDNSRTGQSV